jgi:hypothetical protein
MNKRVIMRVEVEPSSKDRLDAFCERTGMTKVAAVSRLIDWFCKQSDAVQAMVQGLVPQSIQSSVASIILKRLAAKKDGSANSGRSLAGVLSK